MSNNLVSRIEKLRPDEQKIYLTLKRDLSWREGFGILFIKCSPIQESLIVGKIKQDIPGKKIDVLKLEHSIDNLYDLIEDRVTDNPIDILFISGIEKSFALRNYIKLTREKPKKCREKGSVSHLLGHLNWQRERFRDDFNCCLVFTVRKYTLKYLVRRAPDFFDWRSGVFEFPVDKEIDLLQHYASFERDLEQEKQQEVFQDSALLYQRKNIDNKEYISLLEELLLLEYENPGDSQFIYSVVESNIDKLDNFFAQLLKKWIIETCSKVNPEEKEAILEIVENLCIDISQLPLERLSNILEIAITGLETILEFYTRYIQRATTLNYLGYIYSNRIFGIKAENIESEINCYKDALKVINRENFPLKWAEIQNNLGNAYREKIIGNKAENIERAIPCLKMALMVYTKQDLPLKWAESQNNLGNAYRERIIGYKADNIEIAIAYLETALEVYGKQDLLLKWAEIQNNLGNTYLEKIRGDKAENIEIAIGFFNDSLEVYTKEKFPLQWAETQNNLAHAYRKKIRGDQAENIELAIYYLKDALRVCIKENIPLQWAETQNNLAYTYRQRIRGDQAENMEQAIACLNDALKVYLKENCILELAKIQHHLAHAYQERIRGNKAENIEQAIACLKNALKIYLEENCILEWGEIQYHLAYAYRQRIRGNKAENMEAVITCLRMTLMVYTPKNFPKKWTEIQNNLAHAYQEDYTRWKQNQNREY